MTSYADEIRRVNQRVERFHEARSYESSVWLEAERTVGLAFAMECELTDAQVEALVESLPPAQPGDDETRRVIAAVLDQV